MNTTLQEKDAIREKELYKIVMDAVENKIKYSEFRQQTFTDGTKIRAYVERKYGSIISFCETHGMPYEEIVTVNNIVAYKSASMTCDEVVVQIKQIHRELDRGIQEKVVKTTIEGRILVSAAKRFYKHWDEAVLACGIVPYRANDKVVAVHIDDIIRMYREGLSISKIEQTMPFGFHVIKRILIDNGLSITSQAEWSRINNPIKYSKQEVDEYIRRLLDLSLDKRITVTTVKDDDSEMLIAIRYYYKSFTKAFLIDGEYLLDKKVPKNYNRKFFLDQLRLGYELGNTLNSTYFTVNNPGTEYYARKEFGSWENAIEQAGIPLDYIHLSSAEFSRLGHRFEKVLSDILEELNFIFSSNTHDRWKPDFIVGNKWIDAKLSQYTHSGRDKNGLTVIEKYEPNCEELEIVFLRGNKDTFRKITDKTTLIHVSYYVNKLPIERQRHYNALLTQIELESNSIVFEEGA